MAKSSEEYWREREQEHIEASAKRTEDYQSEIYSRYVKSIRNIESEISKFYANYAAKENIDITEAKKKVSNMDVQKFAERAKRYVEEKEFSTQANKELRLYNLTMKVNRLELLKSEVGLELTALNDGMGKYYYKQLTSEALAEIERQAGILGETVWKNQKAVKDIVNASFHNATFSERIWANQAVLKSEIDKLLVRSLTQGKHPSTLIRNLQDLFDVSRKEALRLLVTESARVQTAIQKESFDRYNYEDYLFIAEPTACKDCKPLDDGKPRKVADMMPGENAPPMHPHCRCSIAAHMDREAFEKDLENRLEAEELIQKAKKYEPQVTKDLKEISASTGTKLEGLEYRIKTMKSLVRKLSNGDSKKVHDTLRYTVVSDSEKYVSDYCKTIENLQNKGYNVSGVKNYWNNDLNPYNGVNTFVKTSDGYEFELQYHTPESFELKNGKLHELYERARVLDRRSVEYCDLEDKMFELSRTLEKPKGIEEVK